MSDDTNPGRLHPAQYWEMLLLITGLAAVRRFWENSITIGELFSEVNLASVCLRAKFNPFLFPLLVFRTSLLVSLWVCHAQECLGKCVMIRRSQVTGTVAITQPGGGCVCVCSLGHRPFSREKAVCVCYLGLAALHPAHPEKRNPQPGKPPNQKTKNTTVT